MYVCITYLILQSKGRLRNGSEHNFNMVAWYNLSNNIRNNVVIIHLQTRLAVAKLGCAIHVSSEESLPGPKSCPAGLAFESSRRSLVSTTLPTILWGAATSTSTAAAVRRAPARPPAAKSDGNALKQTE